MRHDTRVVHVGVRRVDDLRRQRNSFAGIHAVLRVTDTGAGIRAEDLPRIFDRFFRGQQATQISGSGIGLAVAAELVQAHGGRLAAASEVGHGTQMTLSLPSA